MSKREKGRTTITREQNESSSSHSPGVSAADMCKQHANSENFWGQDQILMNPLMKEPNVLPVLRRAAGDMPVSQALSVTLLVNH